MSIITHDQSSNAIFCFRKQRIQRKAGSKADTQPFNLSPSHEHLVHLPPDEVNTKIPDVVNANGTGPPGNHFARQFLDLSFTLLRRVNFILRFSFLKGLLSLSSRV